MCSWPWIGFIPSVYHWLKQIRKVDCFMYWVRLVKIVSEHLRCSAILKKEKNNNKGMKERKRERAFFFFVEVVVSECWLPVWCNPQFCLFDLQVFDRGSWWPSLKLSIRNPDVFHLQIKSAHVSPHFQHRHMVKFLCEYFNHHWIWNPWNKWNKVL